MASLNLSSLDLESLERMKAWFLNNPVPPPPKPRLPEEQPKSSRDLLCEPRFPNFAALLLHYQSSIIFYRGICKKACNRGLALERDVEALSKEVDILKLRLRDYERVESQDERLPQPCDITSGDGETIGADGAA